MKLYEGPFIIDVDIVEKVFGIDFFDMRDRVIEYIEKIKKEISKQNN